MVDRNQIEIKIGDRLWVNKPVTVNQYGDEIHDMWNPTIVEIGVDKNGEEYLIAYDKSKKFKFKQSQMFWDDSKHQDGVCKDLIERNVL